jgi:F-type H+-transporting ATPase subunit epsilon
MCLCSFTTEARVTKKTINRYNKYTQIVARALRQSLNETERVGAEKRGLTALRYQRWEDGKGGQQVCSRPLLPASRSAAYLAHDLFFMTRYI